MRRELDAILSVQRFLAGVLPDPWDIRRAVESGREPERPYALIEQVGDSGSDGAPGRQDVTVSYSVNLYLPRPGDKRRGTADDAAFALRELVWQAFKVGPDARRPVSDRVPLFSYEPRPAIQRVSVRGSTAGTWRLSDDSGATWSGALARNAVVAAVQAAVDGIVGAGNAVVRRRADQVFDVGFTGALEGVDVPLLTLDATALTGGARTVAHVLRGAPAPWRGASDYLRVEDFSLTTVRDEDDPTLVMVAAVVRCAFRRGAPLALDSVLLQEINVTAGIGG